MVDHGFAQGMSKVNYLEQPIRVTFYFFTSGTAPAPPVALALCCP